MANTRKESSPTKQSTNAKETPASASAGQLPGQLIELTKRSDLFVATAVIEAARMTGVRDGAPDKSHFKNSYKILAELWEELS